MRLPTLPTLPIRGLQSRILALFLLVIVAVQVGGLAVISVFGAASVRTSVNSEVVAGARVFERVLELDTQRLIEGTRQLTADQGFREMMVAGDRDGVGAALAKHGRRINATVMLLVDANHRVIAGMPAAEIGHRAAYPKLLDRASAAQQATGIVQVGGQVYQLAIVPLLAPQPTAWVVAGFRVNDALAQEFHSLTGLQVSLLTRQDEGEWRIQATTLVEPERSALARDVTANRYASTDSQGNAEFGDEAVTRVLNLAPRADEGVVAVLQAPMATALQPLRDMQRDLALVSLLGVAAAIAVALALGRGIVGPLNDLTEAVRRVGAGDYSTRATSTGNGEVATLAAAFASMRDRVAVSVSQMTDRAHRDALTGLPTRVLFTDRLEQAVAAGARAGSPVAVLALDLDRFDHINATLGHPIGDLLLREVAARLRSAVRRASDSVARVGGDEFAIMMPGSRASDAQRVAEAIRRALEVRMTLDGHVVDVHASVGIAACPEHGTDPATLLERADAAMRAAKRDHLGIALWDERYDEHGEKRLALMSDLRKAVDNEELALIYQPKVALGGGAEHGVEALLRWQHPARGLVPASEFVPLAAQTGYIRTITRWVLERAIVQCMEWRRHGLPISVSVNISARDLIDGELPAWLKTLLEREECAARWLTLEVAESAIVGEPGHAHKNLERLHEMGVRLALDDYGTGYSSLAYLRRLPLDELKIDKSFIMGMAADAGDALIVRSTIELAHKLGLAVVAGSVEDEGTLEQLRALGCDSVQGFLLSRPLAADDIASWVKESAWARPVREKGSLRRVS